MKKLFLSILTWKLHLLARGTVARYKPRIIGVTGSVGKTSAKDAIAVVLSAENTVRKTSKNFNNEFGFPLTIISDAQEITHPAFLFWLKTMMKALKNIIVKDKKYPAYLVLEYGADRPGDIERLILMARPDIGIITAVGEIPAHVEFFAGPKAVAKEKSHLVKSVPVEGFVILNHDDVTVLEMERQLRAHVVTYGFLEGADVRITGFEYRFQEGIPVGISFKLSYGGSLIPVRLHDSFGRAQAYAAAAAASVGIVSGMHLVTITKMLEHYEAPEGRTKLLRGLRSSLVLDDSYNASPASMHAALEVLQDMPAKRKIAVLGDMLEIGKYAPEAHAYVGTIAAHACDVLITVGPRAKFIVEGAVETGLKKKNIVNFEVVEDAIQPIHDMLREGDVILVKASRAVHLERLVESIRDPRRVP